MSTAQPIESQVAPAANRSPAQAKRNRRKYATDAEIDRFVAAVRRQGLTPMSITFHSDGAVTVSQTGTKQPEPEGRSDYDRWKVRKAAKDKAR